MMTPGELAFRQLGISGTDAAAICGVSSYRTEADVWLSKKHPDKLKTPSKAVLERLRWGHRYENLIAEEYSARTGLDIFKPEPRTFQSQHVPWMLGSPDFLHSGIKRGLECKKVSEWMKFQWGPDGTDIVPPEYLLQCSHYMLMCGYQEWDVAALIGESDFRIYKLFANRDLCAMLLDREERFYTRYVKGDEEPEFSTAEAIAEFLRVKYPKNSKRVIEVTHHDVELVKSIKILREARANKKLAIANEEEAKNAVKTHMGDAAEAKWEEELFKATWKNNKTKIVVDHEKIAEMALEKSTLSPAEKERLIAANTSPKPGPRVFRIYDKGDGDDDE